MKYMKKTDFASAMQAHNPFAFKASDGEIAFFRDYSDVYKSTFKRLYKMFPLGFVDVVLFMCEQMQIPFKDAERESKRICCLIGETEFMVNWFRLGEAERVKLEALFRGLHLLTATELNKDMYLQEFERFKNWTELEKLRKEGKA